MPCTDGKNHHGRLMWTPVMDLEWGSWPSGKRDCWIIPVSEHGYSSRNDVHAQMTNNRDARSRKGVRGNSTNWFPRGIAGRHVFIWHPLMLYLQRMRHEKVWPVSFEIHARKNRIADDKTGWTHGRTHPVYKHSPWKLIREYRAVAWDGMSILFFSRKSNKKLQKTFIFKN